VDSNGRTIWIADAHRDNRKRFVAHADEKLTAFVELEAAIWLRKKFTVCSLSELSHTVTGQKTELYGAAKNTMVLASNFMFSENAMVCAPA
jgi:hypothetical protein